MFSEIAEKYSWTQIESEINAKSKSDVEHALQVANLTIEDFKALVSPAAAEYLESMAQKSRIATQKRFGKTIQFYIPLYLSNKCINHCVYCGFNFNNKIERIVLSDEQILREVAVIKEMGYEHILLLTGESPKHAGVDYIEHAIKLVHPHFKQVTLEVQPMSMEDYQRLIAVGLHGVYVYQETYNKERYPTYHPAGIKSDCQWRLNTPDRLGKAEVHKIGLGALLGLENWRVEAVFMAMHLQYLEKKYWKTKYALAFPRIRPHAGEFMPNYIVSDKELAQMIWAFRIFDNDVEISLTTREDTEFRNHMIGLGVTAISAGSKTMPGGYAQDSEDLEQFAINDNRHPKEMLEVVKKAGYEVVWKDWDSYFEIEKEG